MINPGFPVAHKCGCVDNNAVRESIPTLFSQPRSAPFYFWQAWYLTILEIHVNVLFFPTPFKLQFAERMVGSKFAHKAIVIITGANGYVKVCQARGSTILNFIVESATVYAKGFFYNFAGAFHPIVVHKDLHRTAGEPKRARYTGVTLIMACWNMKRRTNLLRWFDSELHKILHDEER